MEINVGWKVQVLLLVLLEAAVIQYWERLLLLVNNTNHLANSMEQFVLINKQLVHYIYYSHQMHVRQQP